MKHQSIKASKLLFLPFILIVSGCLPAQPKPQLINTSFQSTNIKFKYSEQPLVKVRGGVVSAGYVKETKKGFVKKIAEQISLATSSVSDAKRRRGKMSPSWDDFKGKDIAYRCNEQITSCTIQVDFYNGEFDTSNSSVKATNQAMSIVVNFDNKKDNKNGFSGEIKVDSSVSMQGALNAIFQEYPPLLSAPELNKLQNKIANIKLPIYRGSDRHHGEFVIDKPKDIVDASYQLNQGYKNGKDFIFINTKTFPRSSGTLVKYDFKIDYDINPDGTTSKDDSLEASIRSHAEKIAAL